MQIFMLKMTAYIFWFSVLFGSLRLFKHFIYFPLTVKVVMGIEYKLTWLMNPTYSELAVRQWYRRHNAYVLSVSIFANLTSLVYIKQHQIYGVT